MLIMILKGSPFNSLYFSTALPPSPSQTLSHPQGVEWGVTQEVAPIVITGLPGSQKVASTRFLFAVCQKSVSPFSSSSSHIRQGLAPTVFKLPSGSWSSHVGVLASGILTTVQRTDLALASVPNPHHTPPLCS